MAQRFGWPMLIFRNLDALEAQLRQTLSLWRQRVAAEHLREHLRRGRISALQGIRFLEALEDVGEGVLPGSLEEAEAFLNLPLGARPVEEVDGRTELPDLSQSLHELEVNVAHQVDAAIEEAEELVMLGVEDDSDDEAAHPPADAAPEPPDKADAEAEPKPRRRERKLETLLRRQGFHFERRKKRIIFRKSGASEQLFSATAKPKDPRHRPREVAESLVMKGPVWGCRAVGGVVTMFKGVPAEQQWTQVKAAVQEKLPPKVNLWHVSQVNDKQVRHDIVVCLDPLGGATLKCEICFGDLLQKALKDMPKHIRDKCAETAKNFSSWVDGTPLKTGSSGNAERAFFLGGDEGKLKDLEDFGHGGGGPAAMDEAKSEVVKGFCRFLAGHWLDSLGHSILVSHHPPATVATAVLTPLVEHPTAQDRVLRIENAGSGWRCGNVSLEFVDEKKQRLTWKTADGRRSIWSRPPREDEGEEPAFPWLLNAGDEPWLPMDLPRDLLCDGARVAALLDIRQMIGARSEPQERLTHILMDHDLHPNPQGDYLIPGVESPLWQTIKVPETTRRSIIQRISRIPHEVLSQRISWSGDSDNCAPNCPVPFQALDARWVFPPKDQRKALEIARLLALYSVFDNPLSHRRNGVHLGLDPLIRRHCDFELFASPLNAAVPNGHFSSKWPHVEWRFGSIGSYPSVIDHLPVDSVVCINPPFTEAYLADVMARLAELKLRFRLRMAVPILEAPWRKKLHSSLPVPQLLKTYYDATCETPADVLHPTLLWEDPRCPPRPAAQNEKGLGDGTVITSAPPLVPMGAMDSTLAAMVLPATAALLGDATPDSDALAPGGSGTEAQDSQASSEASSGSAARGSAMVGCSVDPLTRRMNPPRPEGWFLVRTGRRHGEPKRDSFHSTSRLGRSVLFRPMDPCCREAPEKGDSELPHRRRTAEARRQPLGVDRARREVLRRKPHGAMAGGAVLRTRGTMVAQDSHGDFKLIKSLLEFHPSPGKSKGLVGIKVARSQQGDSRCFYMIRDDGTEEDFSAKKCLDAVEANPPYVQPEEKTGQGQVGELGRLKRFYIIPW
ncbi:DNA-directed RNA polymerase IV subunit 1 (DNA-directed RNA polymerase D subunit 1) (AtNRPD1a) (Nuclear RNA polymerase D 1a) (Protein RNA-DIRECTED DNA METHYLATION DEFECTIVE 3) (Protein SILENCING DEFECTIVE 4) (Protein SILENCING MOVEMENT DEFICIENT 2) (RNA polymerase IV subunit 1a) (POL IV 1a) [Durusdinium trenchii]|uniref:PCIF1 WW domain-containing protein n=1 Tax=Durusdinium trenchii TaxID=1381693 RepID=A0ABP0NDM6_9DINO